MNPQEAISKIVFCLKVKAGGEFQPADILKSVGDLKRESNADIGPKGIIEIASNIISR